jgi:hypothetical protein
MIGPGGPDFNSLLLFAMYFCSLWLGMGEDLTAHIGRAKY